MQRIQHEWPKEHYYDALCVGASTPERFTRVSHYVQVWTARGRGTRQRCRTNRYGFPIRYVSGVKQHFGFQTGDRVAVVVALGKYTGTWVGRVTVRARGAFVVATADGRKAEVRHRACRLLQRGDGWQYELKRTEKRGPEVTIPA